MIIFIRYAEVLEKLYSRLAALCTFILSVYYGSTFPVELPLINHGVGAQWLHSVHSTGGELLAADLDNVHGIVVALGVGTTTLSGIILA